MNLITPIKRIQIVLLLFIGMSSFQYSNDLEVRGIINFQNRILPSGEEQVEWIQLISYEGVYIFYKVSTENYCDKFLLRIDNTSNQTKEIMFGVGGAISDESCREFYSTINEYRFRNIVVDAFDEVIGDENTPNLFLLIPSNLEPIEDLIQNLQIKTI